MDLIPIFEPNRLDELQERYDFTLDEKSEWVQIEFPYDVAADYDPNFKAYNYAEDDIPDYETNRYNMTIFDNNIGEKISIYIYFDESLETIYAIDDVVQVHDTGNHSTTIYDTVFGDILDAIQN